MLFSQKNLTHSNEFDIIREKHLNRKTNRKGEVVMKNRIAILLAIMMIVAICVSCTAEEEIVPEYQEMMAEDSVDLKGAVFNMAYGALGYFEGEESTLTFTNNTDMGDLAIKRVKDVESKYNCDMNFIFQNGCGQRAFDCALAGSYVYDIVCDESFYLINYMKASAFSDLATFSTIDVFDESKWGSRYMTMSTMFDGHIFGVLPAALPMRVGVSIGGTLVLNETVIAQVLGTDPRDYVDNGEWNWDNFENCVKTYAHNNPLTNEFIYSLSSPYGGFARDLAMSNGVDFFYLNNDGSFSLGYFAPPAVEACEKAFEWFFGETATNVKSDGSWDDMLRMVVNGETALSMVSSWQVLSTTDSLVYLSDDFGLVQFPCGPNAGPNDYVSSYTSALFTLCIPTTAKDPETAAFIVDKLFEPFEGLETDEQIIDYLHKNYFEDRRDAEFYVERTKGEHVFYSDHMHGMSGMFDQIPNNGVTKGLAAYETSIYEAAQKYVLPAYLTLVEYEEFFHE